jgi:spermidine synthase
VVLLLPGIVLGAVLPYLLRTLQSRTQGAGDTIGRLVAVNTTGGILGSLAAGFVLLPTIGAWRGLLVLAAAYPLVVAAVALARISTPRVTLAAAAGVTALALVATTPPASPSCGCPRRGPSRWSMSARDPRPRWRCSRTVTAICPSGSTTITRSGGTRGSDSERNQSVIPMLSHPDPSEVFYLGMGTGITAGAGLQFPVERVVVCKLIRDVAEMAEAHFGPWIGGLFEDDRATVLAEDGPVSVGPRTDTT